MAELADLQKKVEELTRQYAEAQATLEEMQDQQAEPQAASASTTKQRVVVLPRERRLKKFSGKKTDNEQTVEDFVDEIKAVFKAREMSPGEQADFIKSHLEGPAKEETKIYSAKDRDDPDRLMQILLHAFGEKRSLPQLLKLFYERKQKDGETLRAFSHGLRELLGRATKVDPKAVVDQDKTLRDQFAGNVRDTLLRKELKRFTREHPEITFLDVREEALRWSEEEDKPIRAAHDSSSHEVASDLCQQEQPQCQSSTASDTMQQMLNVLMKQQQSLEELTKSMKLLQQGPQQRYQHDGRKEQRPPGNITCYKCGRPGHIARNCTERNNYNKSVPPAKPTRQGETKQSPQSN